jgi:ABC-type lipoprotein release transport system permease subunit
MSDRDSDYAGIACGLACAVLLDDRFRYNGSSVRTGSGAAGDESRSYSCAQRRRVAIGRPPFVSSLLYNVSALDPLAFVGVTLLLVAVAFLACYFPARRAMKTDSMVALRHE